MEITFSAWLTEYAVGAWDEDTSEWYLLCCVNHPGNWQELSSCFTAKYQRWKLGKGLSNKIMFNQLHSFVIFPLTKL